MKATREGQQLTKLQKRIARALERGASNQLGQKYVLVNIQDLASKIKASRAAVHYNLKTFRDAGLIDTVKPGEYYIGTESGGSLLSLFDNQDIPVFNSRYVYKKIERELLLAMYRLKALVAQTATGAFMLNDNVPVFDLIKTSVTRVEYLLSAAAKKLKNTKGFRNKKRLIEVSEQVIEFSGLMSLFTDLSKHKEIYTLFTHKKPRMPAIEYGTLVHPRSIKILFLHLKRRLKLDDSGICGRGVVSKQELSALRARALFPYSFKNFSCDLCHYPVGDDCDVQFEHEEMFNELHQRFEMIHRLGERIKAQITSENTRTRESHAGVCVPRTSDEGLLALAGHWVQAQFNHFQPSTFAYNPKSPRLHKFFAGLKRYSKSTGISEEDLIAGLIALYRYEDPRGRNAGFAPTEKWIGSEGCMMFLFTVARESIMFERALAAVSSGDQEHFDIWLNFANDRFMSFFGTTLEGVYGPALTRLNKHRLFKSMMLFEGVHQDKVFANWREAFELRTCREVSPRDWIFAQLREMTNVKRQRVPDTRLLCDPYAVQRVCSFVSSKESPTPPTRERLDQCRRILQYAGQGDGAVN